MAADPRRILARLDAHTAVRAALAERADTQVRLLVARFGGWYDHAAISTWTAQIVRVVEAAQRGVAGSTDAYLAQVATEVLGRLIQPVGAVDVASLRQGVTHQGVYGRLADQYRRQVASGLPVDEVMVAVLDRARVLVATDLQLANTHQARRSMQDARYIDGYRRILRPEMAKTGTCGLCIAASDRVYYKADLLPVHGNCNCDVLPIVNGEDPGRSLNQDELDRLYDDAGSTAADDLIATKYRIEENGEIGPVLVKQGHAHRGPADL